MQDLIQFLFGTAEFMPHGFCFLWQPQLLWLFVVSNLVIALSYFSIPVALSYFVYKRKNIEFKWIFILFSLFIFACGTTHILAVVTIWRPYYGMAGVTEAVTAVISVLTAIILWSLIPKALLLPSPSELLAANQQLQHEIFYHKETKDKLNQLNADLDRTIALLQASNQAYKASEQRFKHVVNVSPAAIYRLIPTGDIACPYQCTFVSDTFFTITGFEPAEWYADNSLWINRIHPEDRPHILELMEQLTESGCLDFQYRFQHKDGSWRWIHEKVIFHGASDEGTEEVFGAWMDITEYQKNEEELRLAAITFNSLQGIIITDKEATILRVNKAFTKITGYSADEVIGKNPNILHSGKHDETFYTELWKQLDNEGRYEGEIWDRRKDGSVYPQWQSITALKNNAGEITHYVAVFTDISEKKKFENHIQQLAFYDPLTELPNRRLLLDRIDQALAYIKRNNSYLAILFLDLDRFKVLNDSLGHQIGDELLIQVAQRLRSTVREEDTPARLGGDEFVILVHTETHRIDVARNHTQEVAERVLHVLNEPYLLDNHEHFFSSSIGITLFDESCRYAATELLQQADTAMYRSKEKGRNTISFFDHSMQEAADKHLQLENSLRTAINQQQFVLYYQPQVDLDGRIISAEAMIRWLHPEKGMISPDDFIPIAEETGLIVALGTWVLQEACRQIKKWEQEGKGLAHISVNVSSRQFQQHNFIKIVKKAIKKSKISPAQLMVELTESSIFGNIDKTISKMQALRELGVTISIDDFGTGYSSLAYLTKFPLTELKIDQSFVKDIGINSNNEVIIETILSMAKNLGLKVIAEGVESEQQLQFLVARGCHFFQGYHFGRPDLAEKFGMPTSSSLNETLQADAHPL